MSYDASPHYSPVGGSIGRGWAAAVATLPATLRTLAIDGPAILDWARVASEIGDLSPSAELIDLRAAARPWPEVQRLTRSPALADDPDFETLAGGTLAELLDPARLPELLDPARLPELLDPARLPAATTERDPRPATITDSDHPAAASSRPIRILFGPGAAAMPDVDVLWWADLPKRYAEAAVTSGRGRNLMAPLDIAATTKRLFYIDWPLLDRHRDEHAARIDLWLDTQNVNDPAWLTGPALRATCATLATKPHRTRPTFNNTTWGGQWARKELGHNPDRPNSALGYELIAPESGVLIGDSPDAAVEVPFQLVVALFPEEMLGAAVHQRFGTSFPIRFDYLDTVGGGNLSVHCHPRPDYMREVFGWPYTQHETYYMMVGGEQNRVFLGLRAGADVEAFHEAAHRADTDGTPFDMTAFVQTFPATEHQIFLIPAGTPHGSGEGNVVLEVSATPYLYSLRFYDWLRKDRSGGRRPVHVGHAFRNLDTSRTGDSVAESLVPHPRRTGAGDGWHEELIGRLPEMFFEVHRITVEAVAPQDTDGRFHVLTLVEGRRVVIHAGDEEHPLNYAETIAIPAAVGRYTISTTEKARLVKANVVR